MSKIRYVGRQKELYISYCGLDDVIALLKQAKKDLPKDAINATIGLTTEYDSPVCKLEYETPETDNEAFVRIEAEKKAKEYRHQHYEQLKKEFEKNELSPKCFKDE